MSKDTKHTAHELRQSVLSRMDAAKKGIEELSEEELESICGGAQQHTADESRGPTFPDKRGPDWKRSSVIGNEGERWQSAEEGRRYMRQKRLADLLRASQGT